MNEKIVLTLTGHSIWGPIIQPVLVQENASGSLTIIEIAGQKSSGFSQLNDLSKEIVRLSEKITDNALMKVYSKEKNITDFHKKVTPITVETLIRPCVEAYQRKMIHLLWESSLPLFIRDKVQTRNLYETDRVVVSKDFSQVVFHFNKNEDSVLRYYIRVKWQNEEFELNSKPYFALSSEPAMLVVDNKLFVFEDIDIKKLIPFFSKKFIDIPASSEIAYIKTFVRNCVEKYEVKAEGINIKKIEPVKKALLSLENDLNNLPVLILDIQYEEKSYPLDNTACKVVSVLEQEGEVIITWFNPDRKWESSLVNTLQKCGLERSNIHHFSLPIKTEVELPSLEMSDMVDWLRLHSDILQSFEFSQNNLDKIYFTGEIELNTQSETKQDWFDIRCEAVFGEFKIPFINFRNHILNRIREYILPDGTIAVLPLEWYSRYYELMLFSKKSGDLLRLKRPHYRLLEMLDENHESEPSYTFNATNILPAPDGLKANLRPYQQIGFSWLEHIYKNNFGGCLADDMGLGKTVQTIALLQNIANSNPVKRISFGADELFFGEKKETAETLPPSIIVMPTSLIHNWQNELTRFAPNLRVLIYYGNKRSNTKNPEKLFPFYDVILTTYGTLRNDIELLQQCEFHHLILDESQYVKNPDSLSYKAVKQVKASYKLALTGTPVENSLTDLWAQFNIINEGMLGSYTAFRNAYIHPINKNSKEKEESLLRLIQPFILRRTKSEVAPELPPLQEETVYCDMSEEQMNCYNLEKNKLRNSLLEGDSGIDPQTLSILTLQGLTRLRLLANHPALTDMEYDSDSGKFEQIIMRFETLKSEGHKVLIFSSFVKHLQILADHFNKKEWKYAWLSGSSTTTEREDEIQKFMNNPDVNCFFISLKAGGVGLNLTAADYVFIIDPWWNPAAEMQALSRAHRIGQEKNVMVYRFISSNTIEEKIRRLQESKSKLAEVFITSTSPLSGLNKGEISELIG